MNLKEDIGKNPERYSNGVSGVMCLHNFVQFVVIKRGKKIPTKVSHSCTLCNTLRTIRGKLLYPDLEYHMTILKIRSPEKKISGVLTYHR